MNKSTMVKIAFVGAMTILSVVLYTKYQTDFSILMFMAFSIFFAGMGSYITGRYTKTGVAFALIGLLVASYVTMGII